MPMLIHRQVDRCDPLHAFHYDLEYNGVKIGAGRIEMRHTEFPSGKINCLQVGPQFADLMCVRLRGLVYCWKRLKEDFAALEYSSFLKTMSTSSMALNRG